MLNHDYMLRLACAKRNQVIMMRDRGHHIMPAELALIDREPREIEDWYASAALRLGCSLAESMSATYAPAPRDASAHDVPEPTTVAYLDLLWEDNKRRAKMSSVDQVKTVIDAVRARGVRNALIISPTQLTPEAKRELMDIGALGDGGSRTSGAASGTVSGAASGTVSGTVSGAASSIEVEEGSGCTLGPIRVQVMLLDELVMPATRHVLTPTHTRLSPAQAAEFMAARGIHVSQLAEMPDTDPVAAYFDYRPGDIIRMHARGIVQYRVVRREMSV